MNSRRLGVVKNTGILPVKNRSFSLASILCGFRGLLRAEILGYWPSRGDVIRGKPHKMKVFRFDNLNNLDFLPFFKLESFSGFPLVRLCVGRQIGSVQLGIAGFMRL